MAELFTTTLFSDPNLVSYWRMEGNSTDAIGTNTGTDLDITYSLGNGKFGQGAGYNGTTSHIALPNGATLKPTGNFSVNLWVKTSDSSTYMRLFALGQFNGTTHSGLRIDRSTDGFVYAVIGSVATAGPSHSIHDGNWHMITATWDGTTLKSYIDNTLDASVATSTAPTYDATEHPTIGAYFRTDTSAYFTWWNGSIDDVALFSKTLSVNEINILFSSGLSPIGFRLLFGTGI